MKPGQRGTKKLLDQYGDRLVCVRYRYDEQNERRFKTVELIVEEIAWRPEASHPAEASSPAGDEILSLRVEWQEVALRDAVKAAGGTWNAQGRVWRLRYDRIVALGLEDRIV